MGINKSRPKIYQLADALFQFIKPTMASTAAAEKYSSPTVASFPADNDSDSSADGVKVCVCLQCEQGRHSF